MFSLAAVIIFIERTSLLMKLCPTVFLLLLCSAFQSSVRLFLLTSQRCIKVYSCFSRRNLKNLWNKSKTESRMLLVAVLKWHILRIFIGFIIICSSRNKYEYKVNENLPIFCLSLLIQQKECDLESDNSGRIQDCYQLCGIKVHS